MMFVESKKEGDYLMMKVGGRIAGESSIEFYRQVKDIATEEPDCGIVIDFENVDFMDSSGLGSLVAINSHLVKNGRKLVLAAVPENLLGLLKITNLTAILRLVVKAEDVIK